MRGVAECGFTCGLALLARLALFLKKKNKKKKIQKLKTINS
jgi:hypothetical protein